MAADDRPLRAALALALTLLALALLYVQAVETAHSVKRRVGYNLTNLPDGSRVDDVTPGWPAEHAGLRVGDRIINVDGAPIHGQLSYGAAAGRFRAGKPVHFRLVRDDRFLDLTLHPGTPFPLFAFLFNAVAAIGFLGVALLALSQSLRDLRTRLLLGFSLAVAIEMLLPSAVVSVIGHSWVNTWSNCAFYMLTGIEFGLELHLASLIPDRPAWLRRRAWVVPLYYAVGLGAGILWCATYISDERLGAYTLPWTSGQADAWFNQFALPFWALAVSALLASQALRHPEPRGRHQAGLVLSATSAWFLFSLYASILSLTGHPAPQWLAPVQTLVLLCFPVALFAAIFRYHLFDIELAVRRGLIYTTLSGAMVLVFYGALGAFWLLSPPALGGRQSGQQSLWAVGIAMLLLGLLFAPLRRLTHRLIDRRFFPERDELRRRLIALAGELPALGKLPRMGHHLVARLSEIFESRSAVLLIANPESGLLKVLAATGDGWQDAERSLLVALDDPGIELLRRASRPVATPHLAARSSLLAHRLRGLDAPGGLAVPLLIQQRLIGALVVGAKEDGQPYPSEEQDLLTLLAHHVASVFENARLFESATYESLTGLLRREAILEQLDRELERAQRYGRPLTLAMADLDYFKEVNDRYGHLAGDTLLKAISQAASEGLRSTDWIGRYGGEEFLVVLPETDIAGAVSVAEKIRSLVQSTSVPMADGSLARVTISIGLASLRNNHPRGERLSARDLIAAADRSLYEAKNKGRNRIYPLVA